MEQENLPAVKMDFKQDFWSILGHITYLADCRLCFKVSMHKVKLMPVAIGTKKHFLTDVIPTNKSVNQLVCISFPPVYIIPVVQHPCPQWQQSPKKYFRHIHVFCLKVTVTVKIT